MPNELYRTDKNGIVLVDDEIKETALDYLREVVWE
jgi:type I restriction enzyme M protein